MRNSTHNAPKYAGAHGPVGTGILPPKAPAGAASDLVSRPNAPGADQPRRRRRLRMRHACMAIFLLAVALPFLGTHRASIPPGVNQTGPWRPIGPGDIRLLLDCTAWDPIRDERVIQQEIFDEILSMIRSASCLIWADFFLWNDWQGDPPEPHRALSAELGNALSERAGTPGLDMLVMTDPLNRLYGPHEPAFTNPLRESGIPILYTDLTILPDSNPTWSRLVYVYGPILNRIPPLRRWADQPNISNPFELEGPRLSMRQAVRLLHFKANHRKVLITRAPEEEDGLLIGSLNPADGSSAHGNTAVRVRGVIAHDALRSESALAISALSGPYAPTGEELRRARVILDRWSSFPVKPGSEDEAHPGEPRARWLTEAAIAEAIEARLDRLDRGDTADLALFYLSDRGVIRRIRSAAARGVKFRIILDPNLDAFGRRKNGIPNRPVAAELMRAAARKGWDLNVRWADTRGEQFHHKAMLTTRLDGEESLNIGSANWTRRNLRNLNLEANIEIENVPHAVAAWRAWFERAWSNPDGLSRTVPHRAFAESSWSAAWKTVVYRIQEWSGLSTF